VAGDVPVVAGAVTVVVGVSLLWREPSLLWQERHCCRRSRHHCGEPSLLSPEPSLLWRAVTVVAGAVTVVAGAVTVVAEPSLLSLDIILERDGLLSNGGVAELTCAGELVMTSKKFLNRMLMSLLSPEMSLLSSDIVFEGGDGTTSQLQTPTFGSRDRHSTRFR